MERDRIASVFVHRDHAAICQELAIESTNNYELICCDLAHACTLSGSKHRKDRSDLRFVVESLPSPLSCDVKVESLNGGAVLLALVLNTTEDEEVLVRELARGVVVATLVEAGQIHPVVVGNIVELDSSGS